MSEWLVPVSRWVRFVGRGGRAVDGTFDAIQAEVLRGELDRFVCEVRGPLVDARPGDLVWCFIPEGDIGVVAVGRAKAATKGTQPTFAVAVDRPRSRALAADPLPAPTIRRWVPELRQGSVRLDPRPRALTVLDGWLRDRNARDVEMLASLPASPWRATATRGEKGLALAAHDVLGPISRMLRSQDFALGIGKGAGASPTDEGYGIEPKDKWGLLGIIGSTDVPLRQVPTERGDYPAFYAGVAATIRDGAPVPVDPRDALETLRIIERVHELSGS